VADYLRTVIFIDGENFRNNLRNFGYQSNPPHPTRPIFQLEEQHFLWSKFFPSIIKEFNLSTGWTHQLVRVYWYFSAAISPWTENSLAAQRIVNQNIQRVPGLTIGQVNTLAQEWYEKERKYFAKLREDIFENIQRNTTFLEFKYVGQYLVRPYSPYRIEIDPITQIVIYLGKQQGEKGVDVGIAVDMIAKMDNYDTAILISGDADFLPAVRYLKDHLKYVYQFSIAKGVPPTIEYLSAYLKSYVDCFAYFDELRLLSEFLDRQSTIPSAILRAIDDRINVLRPPQLPLTTP
jgi:uncharacterized LabA/DUF88 family protein